MSAKIHRVNSGFVARCIECDFESLTSLPYLVKWWASVHNNDNHGKETK